ncbi:unnamed protein product [Adineta ricciae]|uniref:DNA-directed RNA polymerase III subunit n=1 Tax=Adineta ricciae TaxID=249248 RepID=A0A814L9U6_ADIRI|nr:unnamed protein product [Adineta ricciae]
MAFGRGHASFTIDTLKLAKDSLPAAVTEPPPVFPELLNTPHPLDSSTESISNDYDYKLKLKLNFNSSFRTLHDPLKEDNRKNYILNKWKEEWLLLPRELKAAFQKTKNPSKVKPNISKAKASSAKKTTLNIDFNNYEEKTTGNDEDEEDKDEEKQDENTEVDENDDEGKAKGTEKKKLTDNENEVDGEIPDEQEEEDMDEYEAADYIESYFDPGDGDDFDADDDGGDGGD